MRLTGQPLPGRYGSRVQGDAVHRRVDLAGDEAERRQERRREVIERTFRDVPRQEPARQRPQELRLPLAACRPRPFLHRPRHQDPHDDRDGQEDEGGDEVGGLIRRSRGRMSGEDRDQRDRGDRCGAEPCRDPPDDGRDDHGQHVDRHGAARPTRVIEHGGRERRGGRDEDDDEHASACGRTPLALGSRIQDRRLLIHALHGIFTRSYASFMPRSHSIRHHRPNVAVAQPPQPPRSEEISRPSRPAGAVQPAGLELSGRDLGEASPPSGGPRGGQEVGMRGRSMLARVVDALLPSWL